MPDLAGEVLGLGVGRGEAAAGHAERLERRIDDRRVHAVVAVGERGQRQADARTRGAILVQLGVAQAGERRAAATGPKIAERSTAFAVPLGCACEAG